ncbi:MAG: phosphoadenosine phosphosulfate reductase family protein [Brevundimonas sp.]
MKIYGNRNVFDVALDRFRWLFDEFENVTVDFSGGKDSTVCLNMALQVAEEKGRLPLKVCFLDQEAEWKSVIDYIRTVMDDPRVDPQWVQVPFKLFNATSTTDPWLMCWEEGVEWMRPKEPNSIQVNVYGTDRFAEMFNAIPAHDYPNQKAVRIGGVRASESPARMKGLTTFETYGGATWGRKQDVKQGHYVLYPLYDWTDTDIWKAIHSNGWAYCPVYDAMFQHGVKFRDMRVSNLHHETAVTVLYYLQEIESDTWNALTRRLSGINSAGHMKADMFMPKELPPMFADWREYRDYLLENLISNPEAKAQFAKNFVQQDSYYEDEKVLRDLGRSQVSAILVNDYEGTKFRSFSTSHAMFAKNAGTRGKVRTGKWAEMDAAKAAAA